jgi:hypothetical protein
MEETEDLYKLIYSFLSSNKWFHKQHKESGSFYTEFFRSRFYEGLLLQGILLNQELQMKDHQ